MIRTAILGACGAVTGLALCLGPVAAQDFGPPGGGLPVASRSSENGSVDLPTGPFRQGEVPRRRLEGQVQETAWQIPGPDLSTLDLLIPLRTQLEEAGFEIVLDCEAFACGGFDFRYALTLLPEPEMHVDLGDFRYLSAIRGREGVGIIISRSAETGFVQITQVGGNGPSFAPDLNQNAEPEMPLVGTPSGAVDRDLGARLLAEGAVILEGLSFATGSGALNGTDSRVITDLAAWLRANPNLTIALVGHTDSSGALEGNITLSQQRAEAVRKVLLESYGIAPDRIEAQGVGYLAPIASNLTEEGRRMNRRVEVMVTSTRVEP